MHKYPAILIGILLVVLIMWVSITTNTFIYPLVRQLDNIGYDSQLRLGALIHPQAPKSPIVIIDIDDRSLQVEGHWPWPRSKLAALIDKLHDFGVITIVFDLFFSEKQPNIANELLDKLSNTSVLGPTCKASIKSTELMFDEDMIFAKSISANNTILSYAFLNTSQAQNELPSPVLSLTPLDARQLGLHQANGYITNIPVLQHAAKGSGFINVEPDAQDGIARRANLIMEYKNEIYPALSLQTVLQLFGDRLSLVTPVYNNKKMLEGLKLGSLVIPTDDIGRVIIPFIGKSHTFKYYSATNILHGKIAKNALAGKIVIIGSTATGLSDLHSTAISAKYPGVEIQATLLNGILQKNFSYKPAWVYSANLSIILVFGLIAAFLFPSLNPRLLIILIIVIPPALIITNYYIWEKTGLILSVSLTILLGNLITIFNIIYGYLFETLKRAKLKAMFGQYVPEEHIDAMLKESSNFVLHGENREMTVMFADIRNFTAISEGMPADELVTMLNTFFTAMTEIIFINNGTIDKYVGDNIVAFWGAPRKDKNHAEHALRAALDMQQKIKNMRALWKQNNWPDIHIGVGVNSGKMNVGDMGSNYRRNYTVLGDSVNLASRVEGLTKYYGVEIIVTEYTQKNRSLFIFRKLDRVRVVGKTAGVDIYELICLKKDNTENITVTIKRYHEALNLYYEKKWAEALTIFESLNQENPDVKIYKIYINRIKEFNINPPPASWDGIFEHVTK